MKRFQAIRLYTRDGRPTYGDEYRTITVPDTFSPDYREIYTTGTGEKVMFLFEMDEEVSENIESSKYIKSSIQDDDLFIVCEHCLEEIESREGHQATTKDIPESRLYEVDEYNEYSGETYPEVVGICDWCEEEYPEDELVRIL